MLFQTFLSRNLRFQVISKFEIFNTGGVLSVYSQNVCLDFNHDCSKPYSFLDMTFFSFSKIFKSVIFHVSTFKVIGSFVC